MREKGKYKILFLVDILLIDDNFTYDEYYVSALTEFAMEYYVEYKDYFDIVFDVNKTDKGYLISLFDDYEEYDDVVNYISMMDESVGLKKLLNSMDNDDILKIGYLASLFTNFLCEYNIVVSGSYKRMKQ